MLCGVLWSLVYNLMNSPKISLVGVVFQNNFNERYYSKYYTKTCPYATKEPFNLESFEGQKKF